MSDRATLAFTAFATTCNIIRESCKRRSPLSDSYNLNFTFTRPDCDRATRPGPWFLGQQVILVTAAAIASDETSAGDVGLRIQVLVLGV